jgi:uncharacterized membrane protein
MKYLNIVIPVLVFLLFFSSCQKNKEDSVLPDSNSCDSLISFTSMVKPIIDNNCLQCHNGNQFPDLRTYESISQNADAVRNETSAKRMPIGGSLTVEEIKVISCWVENGAKNN